MRTLIVLGATLASLSLVPVQGESQELADTLYSGGPIITVNDAQPSAEAVAVKDGRILAVGSLEDLAVHRGVETQDFDLASRALLPGFVDSHGHVVFGGLQALSANMLAPPDGSVTDIPSLQATLSEWAANNTQAVERVKMIIGFGYDNAQLAELRHPTRTDLDAVSTELPVVIIHQSGHLGVGNSKALELAGINADSVPPPGGVIQRDEDGEPNGVLEEYAFFQLLIPLLGGLGDEGMAEFARAGSRLWAEFGYTTGQDGRSSGEIVDVLKKVGAEGDLPIDIVAFPDVLESQDYIADNVSQDYTDRVRVGGCKLTIDGSPQGFTALRDRPYF
ncbi:MAG: amidohydrolase family protein, partial [Pseudomonadota bacterium]